MTAVNQVSARFANDRCSDPTFRIAFLFHSQLQILQHTLPRCLEALTHPTAEDYEVVLHCDGTPSDVARELPSMLPAWGVDELVMRRRDRWVSSGHPSTNGHRRLMRSQNRYLAVITDDVVMYRTDRSFDVLAACRRLFESHPDVPVICKVDDHDNWRWRLCDVSPPITAGVRSVNRLADHFIVYDIARFLPVAERFGGFRLDLFIDRADMSYNWEDLASHVGTTGGRRIAFPEAWPLAVYHCDRKVAPDSMYHTEDPKVKSDVLSELEVMHRSDPGASSA